MVLLFSAVYFCLRLLYERGGNHFDALDCTGTVAIEL